MQQYPDPSQYFDIVQLCNLANLVDYQHVHHSPSLDPSIADHFPTTTPDISSDLSIFRLIYSLSIAAKPI